MEEASDIDSDLSALHCRVNLVLAGRCLVIGLPAVSLVPTPSPVRLTRTRVIVDRVHRAKYMQE